MYLSSGGGLGFWFTIIQVVVPLCMASETQTEGDYHMFLFLSSQTCLLQLPKPKLAFSQPTVWPLMRLVVTVCEENKSHEGWLGEAQTVEVFPFFPVLSKSQPLLEAVLYSKPKLLPLGLEKVKLKQSYWKQGSRKLTLWSLLFSVSDLLLCWLELG